MEMGARDAADAMLVNDELGSAILICGGPRHRLDQSEQFTTGHEAGRADQECGDFHVGVAIMREVVDDGFDFSADSKVRPWILARTASRLSRRTLRDLP